MKVLHFCNLLPTKLGSFERLLINLGKILAEHGNVSQVCVAGIPIVQVSEHLKMVKVLVSVNCLWSEGNGKEHPWHFCWPALRLIIQEKPDLVAVSFGNELPCVVVRIVAWLAGVRHCKWVWIQQQQICDPTWLTKRISRIRLLSMAFDHLTAVYEGGMHSMRRRGVPEGKVSTVYNGSNEPTVTKAKGWLRRELGISPDTVLIVCTSWLIERKRIDFLLKAFAAVTANDLKETPPRQEGLPILVIIGDGPLRKPLERLAAELKIADRVHFLGMRNDINDILQDADLFVLTSIAEACANAILEAMSFALPVVATDVGASREQILSGVSGYVVDPNDFDAFVKKLGEVVGDSVLRRRMGAAARQKWETGFSSRRSAENHFALWCRLVGQREATLPSDFQEGAPR